MRAWPRPTNGPVSRLGFTEHALSESLLGKLVSVHTALSVTSTSRRLSPMLFWIVRVDVVRGDPINTLQSTASTGIALDHDREQLRQHALEELRLIDTPESENYDRITRMASRLFGTAIAVVSLTDRSRQWFKSHIGTAGREIPRCAAPCAEVTRSQDFLNVPDLLEDIRFAESPLAKSGIRFYAGAPLTTCNGHTLGSMCVLDPEPRTFTPEQVASLKDFAAMVMAAIELQHGTGRIDATSGLPNRHQLYDDIENQRHKTPDATRVLLVVELADLRHVNDAVSVLGASYLDALVQASTATIRSTLGHNTVLYQVGFASIALLLEEEELVSQSVAELVASHLKVPTVANGIPVVIAAALGASPFRLDSVSPQDALRTAISAARQARQAEVDYTVFSAKSDDAHRRRFYLLTQVRESLDQQQHFSLVYQPRLDLRTGLCTSAEALLRWTHPALGSVSPGEFIPLVEQTALARPMTQWVLATAFEQITAWQRTGLDLRLSINVSTRNLEEEDFATLLAQTLCEHGIQPSQIELEFTESALIRFHTRVLAQLRMIREMGIDLAIDDFGTGYSSFSYLRQLPATIVKLDQSFMRTLAHSVRDQSMVRSMIAMAQDIGYRVVGEGVETQEVLDFLKKNGCDEIQGYFIARPLSPAGLTDFMARQSALHLQVA